MKIIKAKLKAEKKFKCLNFSEFKIVNELPLSRAIESPN
jgi:hypothetical protein